MSPCSKKWASSVHMTFSNHCGLRSIYVSAHMAKFYIAPVSTSNNWWSAWILYRCRSNIPCRIDGSEILVLLSASRALLLPVDVSRLPNLPWHFAQHGHGPLLGWSDTSWTFLQTARFFKTSCYIEYSIQWNRVFCAFRSFLCAILLRCNSCGFTILVEQFNHQRPICQRKHADGFEWRICFQPFILLIA